MERGASLTTNRPCRRTAVRTQLSELLFFRGKFTQHGGHDTDVHATERTSTALVTDRAVQKEGGGSEQAGVAQNVRWRHVHARAGCVEGVMAFRLVTQVLVGKTVRKGELTQGMREQGKQNSMEKLLMGKTGRRKFQRGYRILRKIYSLLLLNPSFTK